MENMQANENARLRTPLISARGLKRYYERGSETVKAIDGVDVDIMPGEMVSILGPSGSGKTTLMNMLSCLDAPDGGSLTINGKEVANLTEDKLTEIRRGVLGFIFQKFHLLPTLSVRENVELPLLFLHRKTDPQKTLEILGKVGLQDRADHLPRELSGGQMQRVAIARALITDPLLLIADEPTGNLDKANGEAIFALFRSLVEQQGMTLLVTTHNTALGNLSDRIITLEDGHIVSEENK
jgi:putative ABC transport system ATP-binding protein